MTRAGSNRVSTYPVGSASTIPASQFLDGLIRNSTIPISTIPVSTILVSSSAISTVPIVRISAPNRPNANSVAYFRARHHVAKDHPWATGNQNRS